MGCPEPVGEGDAGEPSVTPEEDAGDVVGDDAGEPDPTLDAGTPSFDAGTPSPDAGTPSPDAGTPSPDAGTPADDAGTPADDAGFPLPDAGFPLPDAGVVVATCATPLEALDGDVLTGADFLADFAEGFDGTDNSCDLGSGVDAVFVVDLLAAETVTLQEHGGIDAVLKIQQGACDETGVCVADADNGETTGASYTATVDETVTLVVSSYFVTPIDTDYEIRIFVLPPEDCEVVGDEDNNGVSDCDDATCFGVAGVCDTAELNCGDGGDNDGDGLTDCEDVTDCGADAACLPAQGVFESFATDEFDLNGMDVSFTPNAGAVDGFDFSVVPNTGFVDAAGSGTVSGTLALNDDDFVQYTFAPGFEFPFYGQNYTSMFVGSNGFITFGIGSPFASSSRNAFFSRPRIAGFDKDLDPKSGTITVDEFANRIVVTFEDVPDYGSTTSLQTFQMVLSADGSVLLAYDTIALSGTAFVGVSDGDFGGTSLFPDEV
ncbi:MAG: hypothetical protein GY822_29970, partial [Deltaproteobacteria bacterium]|nr:hypothetical protein [Deltaproteobacteria bacterium]